MRLTEIDGEDAIYVMEQVSRSEKISSEFRVTGRISWKFWIPPTRFRKFRRVPSRKFRLCAEKQSSISSSKPRPVREPPLKLQANVYPPM